jgi:hypothetical protein
MKHATCGGEVVLELDQDKCGGVWIHDEAPRDITELDPSEYIH